MAKKEKKVVVPKAKEEKADNVQKVLVENFVALQGVITNLSSKLNNLSDQISKLLGLFEESAKTFMEKDIKIMGGGTDKNTSDKLDQLLEQNKILARGIALLHESNFPDQGQNNQLNQQQMAAPLPQNPQFTQQVQQQPQNNPENINRYQRSISSSK